MTPGELRAKWNLAFPRERDAMVAEAAGWRGVEIGPTGFRGRLEAIGIHPLNNSPEELPAFTTEWTDTGGLLEELAREREYTLGWNKYWYACATDSYRDPCERQAESQESLADAVALLYCLAKLEGGG